MHSYARPSSATPLRHATDMLGLALPKAITPTRYVNSWSCRAHMSLALKVTMQRRLFLSLPEQQRKSAILHVVFSLGSNRQSPPTCILCPIPRAIAKVSKPEYCVQCPSWTKLASLGCCCRLWKQAYYNANNCEALVSCAAELQGLVLANSSLAASPTLMANLLEAVTEVKEFVATFSDR